MDLGSLFNLSLETLPTLLAIAICIYAATHKAQMRNERTVWGVGIVFVAVFALDFCRASNASKLRRMQWGGADAVVAIIVLFVLGYGIYLYAKRDWASVGWAPVPADRITPRVYATQMILLAPLVVIIWLYLRMMMM